MITLDNLTLARIEILHPKLRLEAKDIYLQICRCLTGRAQVRFSQTFRTIAEQNALYAQGRTTPGKIVTWAEGGRSYHNYGLAIDICLILDGKTVNWDTLKDYDGDGLSDWMECVKIFEKQGWEWGGRWQKGKTDMPHFQKTFGKTTAWLAEQVKITRRSYVEL
ncbi:MAG: M15 family peptidase [Pedobacter sp.]|nr:MAG: M15 family peptidase [Pedobacter sp.]